MLILTDLNVADHRSYRNHERVVLCEDKERGLHAIIALHNTTLGPGLGGCRIYKYTSDDDALNDVLRLSRGMTYKSAAAKLPLGGGKAVVMTSEARPKTQEMMEAFAEAVDALGGIYITAEDVGSTVKDMDLIYSRTKYVTGLGETHIPGVGGNPSPRTARGVFSAISATVKRLYNRDDLAGLHFTVQGIGSVGYDLCRRLYAAGARLTVADISPETVAKAQQEFPGTQSVLTDEIYDVECDVFAPCALGSVVSENTLPRLKCKAIVGAANNQLAESRFAETLAAQGILYITDYIVNAGGVIFACYEHFARVGQNPFAWPITAEKALEHIDHIGTTVTELLTLSEKQKITTVEAANHLAEQVLEAAASKKKSKCA